MQQDNDDIGFECVRPIEGHARLIMEWRNDPQTLAMSFHSQPKEWQTFYREFLDDYFGLHDLPAIFVLFRGERVAFVKFNLVEHPKSPFARCCDISINVAPKYRGKGIGQQALIALKGWVRARGYDAIYAEVKNENQASHKAFLGAGYKLLGKGTKKINDIEVPIKRYWVELNSRIAANNVFIIAEAGSNWRMGTPARDLAMGKALIDVAAEAGADAIKFQTYKPESVYVKNAGKSRYLAEAGIEEDIRDIFTDLTMPYEMIPELAKYCKKAGIEFMSTPFSKSDFKAVDKYVKRHKIASYEINHIHLIELAARSGKPLYLSTGAAVEEDIKWAVDTFRANGGKDLTLLQCTACYPAPADNLNLKVIPWLKHRFNVAAGLSDHSRYPLEAPLMAVALGATVIEKHFTLDNRLPGPDHAFALLPVELKALVQAVRLAEKMVGSGVKTVLPSEQELRLFARRGLQAIRSIKKGDLLQEGVNMEILRPGEQSIGIHPKFLKAIEGKKATRAIREGCGIQFGDWG